MTLPTDEEMRAEIPAIAKPYVLERDREIARLHNAVASLREELRDARSAMTRANAERDAARVNAAQLSAELDEVRAERDDALAIAERLQGRIDTELAGVQQGDYARALDGSRRHEGWLTIVDTIDDAELAIAMFQDWRSTGYAGDPGSVARLGRVATETPAEAAATAPRCTCPNADCPCHPGDEPGSCDCSPKSMPPGRPPHHPRCGVDARGCVSDCPAFAWDLAHARKDQAASPVADGPIATRFDAFATDAIQEHTRFACELAARDTLPTEADYLHAAQLGARAHVVPHIKAAAAAAMKDGDHDGATAYLALAALINGDLDPQILRYGEAFLRFVRGAG